MQAQNARKRLTEVEAQLRTTRAELEELRAEVPAGKAETDRHAVHRTC
jgi:hypothetical protein